MTTPAEDLTRTLTGATVLLASVLAVCASGLAYTLGYDAFAAHVDGEPLPFSLPMVLGAGVFTTLLAAFGVLVWLGPERPLLLGWTGLAAFGFMVFIVEGGDLTFGVTPPRVASWRVHALEVTFSGVMLVLVGLVPIVVAVTRANELIHARRARARPGPPIARIHRER